MFWPRTVQSGSTSQDDCGRTFSDELCELVSLIGSNTTPGQRSQPNNECFFSVRRQKMSSRSFLPVYTTSTHSSTQHIHSCPHITSTHRIYIHTHPHTHTHTHTPVKLFQPEKTAELVKSWPGYSPHVIRWSSPGQATYRTSSGGQVLARLLTAHHQVVKSWPGYLPHVIRWSSPG